MTGPERFAVAVISLLVAVGLIALLSGFFAGQDSAALAPGGTTIGQVFPDQGSSLLAPGAARPAYSSNPPTSGPHLPAQITRQAQKITDDQLLSALSAGDVVLLTATAGPVPPQLLSLAREVSGPFTPALAASGLAVIVGRRSGIHGVVALAWTRMLTAASADDPQLRAFARQWLGKGSSG